MGVVTKYICDRCKTEVFNLKNFFNIKIGIRPYNYHYGFSEFKPGTNIQGPDLYLCRGCCEDFGLRFRTDDHPATTPTMEDFLRDFVTELVQDELRNK